MKNPTYKRTPKERDADLLLIFQYLSEGRNWMEIRDMINGQRPYHCTFQNYYWQYCQELEKGLPDIDINEEKRRQLAEIRLLKEELIDSWYKSKGKMKERSTKGVKTGKKKDGDFSRQEQIIKEWEEAGAAAYLAQYVKLLEREAKILGLDAPDKVEVKNRIIDWTE